MMMKEKKFLRVQKSKKKSKNLDGNNKKEIKKMRPRKMNGHLGLSRGRDAGIVAKVPPSSSLHVGRVMT